LLDADYTDVKDVETWSACRVRT